MPVEPPTRRETPALRRAASAVAIVLAVASVSKLACGRGDDAGRSRAAAGGGSDLQFTWALEPRAASVGPAKLTVRLLDARGAVTGATVRLEAHMAHPGMAPVIADATERGGGVYDISFHFTMPGDWVLLVSAALPGGQRVERRVDVAGVRPRK
jgi:YtkA-like